jgi:hypothetical protein
VRAIVSSVAAARPRAAGPGLLPLFLLVLGAVAAISWYGSTFAFWSDFHDEAWPAYRALGQGQLGEAAGELPVYGAYLLIFGSPGALVASAMGGEDELTQLLTSLPAVLAIGLLLTAAAAPFRRRGVSPAAAIVAAGTPLPLVWLTLKYGHAEDVMASAASVGAVLAALGGRLRLAVLLLIAGIVSKQWAILAVAPAMLAAPRHRGRIGAVALAGAGAVLLPLALLAPDAQHPLLTTSQLFHAHQLWWPLGVPIPDELNVPHGATAVAPGWLAAISRPLIVGLSVPLALLWWRRGGPRRRPDDALLLLALLFLGRCALDPWNIHYYHLPLVVSLVAWEGRRGRELPVLALLTVAAVWLSFLTYKVHYGYGPFLLYTAWALPLGGYLGWMLLGAPLPSERHGSQERSTPRSRLRAVPA